MAQYILSKLQLTNFRNLSPDIISFATGINCIIGENGNGKTNILEGVHVLLTGKSFKKNTSFPQYLSIDGEQPEIILSAVLTNKNDCINYSTKLSKNNNLSYSNGKKHKKRLPLSVIFINPFDSYGFHNIPASRRAWFDSYMGILDKAHKKNLNRYKTLLRFKNTLLGKRPLQFKEQIRAINLEVARVTVAIIEKKKIFLWEMKGLLKDIFKELFHENHALDIILESKFSHFKTQEEVFTFLDNGFEKDLVAGHSLSGIHKDDYTLLYDGLNSFEFCSLGQQKTSYLSLLFAYINLFRYKFDTYPLVLIDDVSGELDHLRWKRLVKYLEKRAFQVLITTANDKFKEELENIASVKTIEVVAGNIF